MGSIPRYPDYNQNQAWLFFWQKKCNLVPHHSAAGGSGSFGPGQHNGTSEYEITDGRWLPGEGKGSDETKREVSGRKQAQQIASQDVPAVYQASMTASGRVFTGLPPDKFCGKQ